jgi:hypothetical protein
MKGSIVYGLNGLRVKLGRKEDPPVHPEMRLAKGNLAAKFCRRWSQLGGICCLVATRTRNRNGTSANAGVAMFSGLLLGLLPPLFILWGGSVRFSSGSRSSRTQGYCLAGWQSAPPARAQFKVSIVCGEQCNHSGRGSLGGQTSIRWSDAGQPYEDVAIRTHDYHYLA